MSYEVHHRSHCFVCHSFCLLSHFETPQSSYLPMSILKLMSMNLSQSSRLLVFVSKSCLPVCLKAHVCLCLFQRSCLLVCFKVHVYMCLSQNSCLPIVCFKALVYQCMSQSFYLPLSIYMKFWRFMSFEAHHKHGLLYHIIFACNEFSSSSKFIFCVPQFVCMKFGSFLNS